MIELPSFRSRKDGSHYPLVERKRIPKSSATVRTDSWKKRRDGFALQQIPVQVKIEIQYDEYPDNDWSEENIMFRMAMSTGGKLVNADGKKMLVVIPQEEKTDFLQKLKALGYKYKEV